jgi:hypothetical protein
LPTVPINAKLQGVFDHVSAQRGADALSDAILDLILTILNLLRCFLETSASPIAPAPHGPSPNAAIRPQPEATIPRRTPAASPRLARRHQRPSAAKLHTRPTPQPIPTETIPNLATATLAILTARQARPPNPHPRRRITRPEGALKHA